MESAEGPAPQLRPLGVGEVLDVAIKVYIRHARELFKAVAVVVLPVYALLTLVLVLGFPQSNLTTGEAPPTDPFAGITPAEIAALVAAGAVGLTGALLAQLLAIASSFKGISDAYLGAQPNWRTSVRFAGGRLAAALWVSILAFLVILIGFLALVLPGIYLSVAFQLAIPVILAENLRGGAALRRSFRLIRGRWWPTFGVIFLAGLLATLVGFVIGAVLGAIATFGVGDSPVAANAVGQLAQAIATVVSVPFQAAVVAVAYFDLRVRKEGFDLQLLAERLGTTPSADAGLAARGPAPGSGAGPPLPGAGPPATGPPPPAGPPAADRG